MTISIQQLLDKMEQEMIKAKHSQDEEHIRQHVYAIKTLCEMIVEDEGGAGETSQANWSKQHAELQILSKPIETVAQPKPIQTDDGANGDSLFDF
ncbi:YwdI family protein [Heyndrickxia ginsengihumi]|uniref:YwdI family protein n=1 Tax=Heyndrickxia ginsengihumi TaxID=363870 RepID=UPI00046FDA3B|nr:YwdI family protein [Heyndrickxia ginsengihumi]MBE6184004.1 hypothetical protein [Bacillus sp. (in: firmicutes)]MCM3022213.1 YwdI family protein [Heyndrickxia ginsengihumi]